MIQENSESPADYEVEKRPIGVWILTIFAGLMKGLFPIAFIFMVFVFEDSFEVESLPPLAILGNLALGVGIAGSAIAAWRGSDRGRIVLLIFVVLVYGLVAYNNYQGFVSAYNSATLKPSAVARDLRGVLIPVLYIWYFTRQKTLLFYKPGQGAAAPSNS